jgi:hypothetical protein
MNMTNQKSSECPKVIANALFQVQKQIATLGYDSTNDFSNYNYVSIDKYYEKMRPLMNDAGILIIPDELESSISEDKKLYRAVYQFTVIHKDGAVWNFPIRRSITLPFVGAQSSGIALSYLEKIAMRTIFKINSGDKDSIDADSLEQQDFSPLDDEQKDNINQLLKETNADVDAFLKHYEIESVKEMSQAVYDQALKMLKTKQEQQNSKPQVPSEDVVDAFTHGEEPDIHEEEAKNHENH